MVDLSRIGHSEKLADEVIKQKIVESISTSEVGRILKENDLQPHRSRYWLNVKPDEQRDERINRICAVYENAAVTPDELTIKSSTTRKAGGLR